jgi:hypothetical protein
MSKPAKGSQRPKAWESYEKVAEHVLSELGLKLGVTDIRDKRSYPGKLSGTDWDIDVSALREGDQALIIVECRRLTSSRIKQEAMGAIAYRILDLGAGGGITVSPYPLQKGAAKIAAASNVQHVELTAGSRFDLWVAKIAAVLHIGITEQVPVSVKDSLRAVVRNARGEIVEERDV